MGIIRQLDPGRWKEYRDIRMKAVTDEPLAFATTLVEEEMKDKENWYSRLKFDASSKIIFYEQDGALVGMIGIQAGVYEKLKHSGLIYSFYVDSNYQHQGIGRKLMYEAIRYLRSHKVTTVELCVTTTQTNAISFYEKFGFEGTGLHKNALKHDDKLYDFIIMNYEIK